MKRWLAVFLLISSHLLVFGGVWIGSDVVLHRDLLYLHYPMKAEAGRQWLDGRLPQWDPGRLNGQPLAANPNYAAWYPANVVLGGAEPVGAGSMVLAAHHLWLLLGFVLLCRRLGAAGWTTTIGGLVLSLAGPILASILYYNLLVGCSWIPWLLLARCSGRFAVRTAGAALGVAVAVLAGSPFAAFACLLCALLLELLIRFEDNRRPLPELALVTGAAAFAAAVQLWPATQLLGHALRSIPKPYATTLGYFSFHPLRILEFFVPHLFGDGTAQYRHEFWGGGLVDGGTALFPSPYVGVTVLVLGLLLLRRKPLVVAGAVGFSLVMAFGRYGGVHYLLTTVIPPLAQFRYPEKYLLLIPLTLAFAIAIQSGEIESSRRRIAIAVGIAGLLLAAGLFGGPLADHRLPQLAGGELTAAASDHALTQMRLGSLTSAAFAFGIVLVVASRLSQPFKQVALVLLVATDLGLAGWKTLPRVDAGIVSDTPPLAAQLERDDCQRLYHEALDDLVPQSPAADAASGGYTELAWRGLHPRVGTLHGIAYALDPPVDQMETRGSGLTALAVSETGSPDRELLRRLGVSHVFHAEPRPPVEVERTERVELGFLSWLGPTHDLFFDDGRGVIEPATVVAHPTTHSWRVRSERSGRLLTTISSAPGWRASIDGEPVATDSTPWGTLAVPIAAGDHRLEIRYRTPGLGTGLAVSLLTWAGLVGWLARDLTRRGRFRGSPIPPPKA